MDNAAIMQAVHRALHEPDSGFTFLHRFMGVRLAYADEQATLEFDITETFFNRQGNLQGGVIAVLFDMAMGYLHRNAIGPGITLEMKVSYLRAVQQGLVTVSARFVRKGRSISFVEADARNASGEVIALVSATWKSAANA
ncbi:MAG TPA: PaaI family thioesterase [Devosia sp.]|nr:PaaI family thioesterase [Devosia sp.]